MKYKLTKKGLRESAKRSLQRKFYYTPEDKIFKILRHAHYYDLDTIYIMIKEDKTVIDPVTKGTIKGILHTLISEEYLIRENVEPIQPNEMIKGGTRAWQNSQLIR